MCTLIMVHIQMVTPNLLVLWALLLSRTSWSHATTSEFPIGFSSFLGIIIPSGGTLRRWHEGKIHAQTDFPSQPTVLQQWHRSRPAHHQTEVVPPLLMSEQLFQQSTKTLPAVRNVSFARALHSPIFSFCVAFDDSMRTHVGGLLAHPLSLDSMFAPKRSHRQEHPPSTPVLHLTIPCTSIGAVLAHPLSLDSMFSQIFMKASLIPEWCCGVINF